MTEDIFKKSRTSKRTITKKQMAAGLIYTCCDMMWKPTITIKLAGLDFGRKYLVKITPADEETLDEVVSKQAYDPRVLGQEKLSIKDMFKTLSVIEVCSEGDIVGGSDAFLFYSNGLFYKGKIVKQTLFYWASEMNLSSL